MSGEAPPLELKAQRAKQKRRPYSFGPRVPLTSPVLGLDLASSLTGWALVVDGAYSVSGTFKLPDRATDERRPHFILRRRDSLHDQLGLIIRTYRPDVVAYEFPDTPRMSGSIAREYMVAQALGIVEALLISVSERWPIDLLAVPMTVAKFAATGKRGARKESVRRAMEDKFALDAANLGDDAIDALSIAYAVLDWPTPQINAPTRRTS